MAAAGPRVALLGVILESNGFAPVATEADFRRHLYVEGAAMVDQARQAVSPLPRELSAFVQTMDATGPWQPLPLLLTACPPWGPVETTFLRACLDRIAGGLAAAGPVDGVYIANHGAMVAGDDDDPDGTLIQAVRDAAGADAAVIATLDLHANISARMVAASDALIGYQTNPHVDMAQRGEEAALLMRRMLAGLRPRAALQRLPLVPPSVTLLTAEGPYGELIDHAQRRCREAGGAIVNASVFGGFAFADVAKTGLSVVVTARDDQAAADDLALELARRAWARRGDFRKALTPLDDAVAQAVACGSEPGRPALIFSDAGDNPGGGGEGRTTDLLAALAQAGARGMLYAGFHDPALAAEAHALGEGASFTAVFNRDHESDFARPLTLPARVAKLSDGDVVGRLGIYQGRQLRLGPAAALEIGGARGIVAVVISARVQAADPVFFEMFGLDIAAARSLCVKSRGHFRAGFAPWFAPEQVVEVDTAGLTSPVLNRFAWRRLPRPVYPLDPDTTWPPAA